MFVTGKYDVEFVAMEAEYKTPRIAKKVLNDGRIPVLPYTRYKGNPDWYKSWEYEYDAKNDCYICQHGGVLRHTTTDRNGERTYRSDAKSYLRHSAEPMRRGRKS